MRNEVLRMERVTYKEDEVVKLEDFNLQIFQGEIMGFMPVNSHGKTALLKLLTKWQRGMEFRMKLLPVSRRRILSLPGRRLPTEL